MGVLGILAFVVGLVEESPTFQILGGALVGVGGVSAVVRQV